MNVELSEVTLDVEVSGEGPAVLLVHGFPDSRLLWRHQIPALNAAGFTTVAPTLRGFGASSRPEGGPEAYHPAKHAGDLLELLAKLGLDRVHLVGHDWGSGIVQGIAQALPERVRSLSLLSVGHLGAYRAAGWGQRQLSWYTLLFQLAGLSEEWLSRDDFAQLREMLAEHPEAEAVIEPLRAPGALTSALNVYRTGLTPEIQFGEVELHPLAESVPVMGVWSDGDRFLTERSMADTGEYVSGPWRYERVEGAGHWFPLERPERLNELLLSFLKEH
ncbi:MULTISPECIES: alpha/beta fold hydrolase [unclassified Streptomyces]|uniref:alpha/beta fold hydrolase n=1 Tax=unclassified Streptomyces TaxID=2593676 RepID=UPI00166090A4|nr:MULTISPECIES: alpha/beta fold hydrolase [unclassified Streptomyces]MBD0709536.1 alpha/beta hydrolase [Streptomyces sp. CBMA291]MBD0718215.1 alpha/beta hydrolase [Streptomyces sp. CBMA370]